MYFRVKESITDFPFPKTIFIRQFPPFDFDRVAARKKSFQCVSYRTHIRLDSRERTPEKRHHTVKMACAHTHTSQCCQSRMTTARRSFDICLFLLESLSLFVSTQKPLFMYAAHTGKHTHALHLFMCWAITTSSAGIATNEWCGVLNVPLVRCER